MGQSTLYQNCTTFYVHRNNYSTKLLGELCQICAIFRTQTIESMESMYSMEKIALCPEVNKHAGYIVSRLLSILVGKALKRL
jgi:hypothetical protein